MMDDIREKSFTDINTRKLWTKGRMVKKDRSIEHIINQRLGTEPLYLPGSIPAFALSAGRNKKKKASRGNKIEPFIFRNYNYSQSTEEEQQQQTHNGCTQDLQITLHGEDMVSPPANAKTRNAADCLVKGCSSVSLAKAMSATSAVPTVYKAIKMNIEGKEMEFADGGIFCENPIAIAISEARRLFPDRPLGVIMSVGLNTREDEFCCRAIEMASQYHPSLHFHRIIPNEVIDNFSFRETDPNLVASFQAELRQFLETDKETNDFLDETIDKLLLYAGRNDAKDPFFRRSKKSNSDLSFSSQSSKIKSPIRTASSQSDTSYGTDTSFNSSCVTDHSQNRVFNEKKGWHGYGPRSLCPSQELELEKERKRSLISLLLGCFRKKNKKTRYQKHSRATTKRKERPLPSNEKGVDGTSDVTSTLHSAFSNESFETFNDNFLESNDRTHTMRL